MTPGRTRREAAYYLGTNRNKRSVTCDISKPAGQALIRELVAHCDVFVENFKVGDMARYGLDYASLKTAESPAGLLQRDRLRPDRALSRTRRLRLRRSRAWAA